MKLSMMNRLSTLGMRVIGSKLGLGANYVTLEAGDDQSNARSIVFTGTIFNAYADPSGQPDVPFILDASSGGEVALRPVPPTSFNGVIDVANAMQTLAGLAGLKFENGGVAGVTVVDPYLPGTAREQIKRLARPTAAARSRSPRSTIRSSSMARGSRFMNNLTGAPRLF